MGSTLELRATLPDHNHLFNKCLFSAEWAAGSLLNIGNISLNIYYIVLSFQKTDDIYRYMYTYTYTNKYTHTHTHMHMIDSWVVFKHLHTAAAYLIEGIIVLPVSLYFPTLSLDGWSYFWFPIRSFFLITHPILNFYYYSLLLLLFSYSSLFSYYCFNAYLYAIATT